MVKKLVKIRITSITLNGFALVHRREKMKKTKHYRRTKTNRSANGFRNSQTSANRKENKRRVAYQRVPTATLELIN